MLCKALKPFTLSDDGITSRQVEADAVVEVPNALVAGLRAEGFIAPAGPAPETKVIERAPEVGAPVALTEREVHADLEALGAEFDPRDGLDDKMVQRDEGRAARAMAVEPAPDAYPNLSDAQEQALDRDGDNRPGGAPKGGNKRAPKSKRA